LAAGAGYHEQIFKARPALKLTGTAHAAAHDAKNSEGKNAGAQNGLLATLKAVQLGDGYDQYLPS
jgi:hypothetical protein